MEISSHGNLDFDYILNYPALSWYSVLSHKFPRRFLKYYTFLRKNYIFCVIEVSASNRLFLLDYAFCTYQIKLCAIQPIDNKGLQTRYIN